MYLGAAERRTTTIGIGRGVYLMYVSMLEGRYRCQLHVLLLSIDVVTNLGWESQGVRATIYYGNY